MIAAIVMESNNDLFMIFNMLVYYWIVGLFCFIIGGTVTLLFIVDTNQYRKAIEADPKFLLTMLEQQKYVFIERLMKSGVCGAHRLVENAVTCMLQNNVNPKDE